MIQDATDAEVSNSNPTVVTPPSVADVPIPSAPRAAQQTVLPNAIQARNVTDQVFKIVDSGVSDVLTVSGVGGGGQDFDLAVFSVRVTHSLGFVPLVVVSLASSTAISPVITPGIGLFNGDYTFQYYLLQQSAV